MASPGGSAQSLQPRQPSASPISILRGVSPSSSSPPLPPTQTPKPPSHASPATSVASLSFAATPAAPTTQSAPTLTAAAAAAVAMDPAALWAALDLPAPESMPSQHTARRVVLLGRPLSGKRTLCRRLCFAADAQYAAAAATGAEAEEEEDRFAGAADNGRQPLYRPASSDDEDAALLPSAELGGWNMPGAFSAAGALQEGIFSGGGGAAAAAGPAHQYADSAALSHGSGVAFDYVVQRVPTRVARSDSGGGGGGSSSGARRAAASAAATAAAQPSGTVRRTTEFFCCDSPGALTMALPTIADIETAVVLMVVDVSDVATIRHQLDSCYNTLNAYVASVLRTQAPTNDEVRRLQLAAAQQDYWFAEEQKMRTTRINLASSGAAAAAKDGRGDVLFKDPLANLEKVNSNTFRIPASAGTVCPMHTIIVCTKAEGLERASRAIGTLDGAGGGSDNDALFTRLGVAPELAVALRRSRLSLMSLTSQLIRHYALYRRAAVASLSQRVNMTTAGADGDYANSALVNPFYKGLWAYIAYVLYSAADANGSPSSDVLRVCSARVYPHGLLPCGLDAPGLLSPFITSDPAQLADLMNSDGDDAASSAIRTTTEDVRTPDGVFALHQRYLQVGQADVSATWGRTEAVAAPAEDTGMVWDSL